YAATGVTVSGVGNAPRSGIAGKGAASTPVVAKCEPAPTAKPGPASHATAHATRFGTKASWAVASATPPSASSPRLATTSATRAWPASTHVTRTTPPSANVPATHASP